MKRGKYLEFNVDKGYIKNKITSEIVGTCLELYCYTADENNIYYETPHIDYPDNYVHIIEEKEIPIRNYLEKDGVYNNFYAIISKHKRISSIENFKIDECNTFYSVNISKEVAEFLNFFGLDRFEVKENLFIWKLNELPDILKGSELLFFIDSKDELIQEFLNRKRLKVMFENIKIKTKEKIESEKILYIDNNVYFLTYSMQDEFSIRNAILTNSDKIINRGVTFYLTIEYIKKIYEKLEEEKEYWNKYKIAYLMYINSIIVKDFNLDNLSKYENFLIYGYTNDFIISKMRSEC